MKVSHVIYKVENLQSAVEEYQKLGFAVEYGSAKNPYNAIIYFSEGPYLELLASSGMPGFLKKLLRLFGKAKMADRVDFWDTHKPGPCGVALENYEPDLAKEKAILEKHGQGYFQMHSGRADTKGRKLKYTCVFPDELQIPFLMTYFNIDPKPKNFVHPNGALRIKSIAFGTNSTFRPLIEELCQDDTLILFEGTGCKDLVYDYAEAKK